MATSQADYEQLKHTLKLRLAELLDRDTSGGPRTPFDRGTISTHVRRVLSTAQAASSPFILSAPEQERLVEELADEIVGLGPLEPLLVDSEITEIMVNGPAQIYIERHGRLERLPAVFRDTNHLMAVIERLLAQAGTSVTESNACVDASLPDGTRVNVIIPPLVLNGPTMTIRAKLREWHMDDFLALGSLSAQAAEFLEMCVRAKVNLVVSGGTSTGKTALVSVLSSCIPAAERIITIENIAELDLPNREHWIRLVARERNIEGRGEISLRNLVRNALRMRPDRIILGEARGGEALDVVQAMHTGHDGVITVLHANSSHAALERLETLMLMSEVDLPPRACRMQIASAVDLVVQMGRFADGSRRIAAITQLLGVAADDFALEDLFRFEAQGFSPDGRLHGTLRYTGVRPKFLQKFQLNNVPLPGWIT